jgi:hypothetical protein
MKRFESRKLLDAARGQSCVLCGTQDGTVVACHLPGSKYGMAAGWGLKTHDWLTAHLCHHCHYEIDGIGRQDFQLRMRALCLTLERLFAEGKLRVE